MGRKAKTHLLDADCYFGHLSAGPAVKTMTRNLTAAVTQITRLPFGITPPELIPVHTIYEAPGNAGPQYWFYHP